jgi:hypothetical protein
MRRHGNVNKFEEETKREGNGAGTDRSKVLEEARDFSKSKPVLWKRG